MVSTNIQLTEQQTEFVNNLVASGRFQDFDEVLRAGLRMLEQASVEESQKLELLKSLTKAGLDQLDQGQGLEFHSSEEVADHIAKLGKEVEATIKCEKQ